MYLLMRDSGVRNYNEFDEHVGLTEERRLSSFSTSKHSKSEKVCGTAFSVKKKIAEKVHKSERKRFATNARKSSLQNVTPKSA